MMQMMSEIVMNAMEKDTQLKNNKSHQDFSNNFKLHVKNVMVREKYLTQNVRFVKEKRLYQELIRSHYLLRRG